MQSLEFDKLPLIEATCNLVYAEPRELSLDMLCELRQALRPMSLEPHQFTSSLAGSPVPFAFMVGVTPGSTFGSESGLTLTAGTGALSASWRRGSETAKYVRYATLREALTKAAGVINPAVGIVNMAYVNLAGVAGALPRDLLDAALWPPIAFDAVKDYNVAWDLPSGIEFRLQVTPQEANFLITTAAGIRIADNWGDELERIHAALQETFDRIITDRAKEVWQWRRTS
ncbi:MAG: hypothetical protein ACR2HJ_04820 [Fimbriimonadales bacterium]